MATTKQRINISADKNMAGALKEIAKRDHVPLATKAVELLRMSLEREEDIYFATIAEERMSQKVKRIPHHLAWK